jgi:hypothetical protein
MNRTINPAVTALSAVVADVANTQHVEPHEIAVDSLIAHEWRDSCLELPKPDEICNDVPTPGYYVRLGDRFRYRTDQQGNIRREEVPLKCGDWKAWLSKEPPTPPMTLHVTGTCTFPTPGYTAELRPSVPQGINPWDLLLNLVVQAPSGSVPDVLTDVEVRYDAEVTTEYKTVTILGYPQVLVEVVV